jgi:hypothetical protein
MLPMAMAVSKKIGELIGWLIIAAMVYADYWILFSK